MRIESFSTDELKLELEAREAKAKAKEAAERKERISILLGNKGFFLSLMEHSRTSCSDNNPCNYHYHPNHGSPDCQKCALIELNDYETDIDVNFNIQLRKIKE